MPLLTVRATITYSTLSLVDLTDTMHDNLFLNTGTDLCPLLPAVLMINKYSCTFICLQL